jgi:hypothetical protein
MQLQTMKATAIYYSLCSYLLLEGIQSMRLSVSASDSEGSVVHFSSSADWESSEDEHLTPEGFATLNYHF